MKSGGNIKISDKETVIKEITEFIETVESNTSNKMIVYTNGNGYSKYIKSNFDSNDLWICTFNNPPKIKKKWGFWQHSHKWKVDGIESSVDINTFNGDYNEWKRYLKK